MSADMRAMTAHSDRIGRYFARRYNVSTSDFHALLHIMVAETAGEPLTMTELRERMDVSPAAITYLVDRMIDAGHIRREADPVDRRKSLIRYEHSGLALGRAFFSPLGAHMHKAFGGLGDKDLVAAHRVFTAILAAMSTFEDELRTHRVEPPTSNAGTGQRRKVKG